MIPGQASGAQMLEVAAVGSITPATSGLCSEGLHATAAHLFGERPPAGTKPPPGSGVRDGAHVPSTCSFIVIEPGVRLAPV